MNASLPRLVVHLASGQLRDLPEDDEWLSAAERAVLAGLKLEKRRGDWRLGRWLARRAVAAALGSEAAEPSAYGAAITISAAEDGAPEVHGTPRPVTLSISHSHGHGRAAAALGTERIGCDLELIEPRSDRFIRDWLTPDESRLIFAAPADHRPLLANLCWCGKEAASKVLRVGLRFDTRSFAVTLPHPGALETARSATWQQLGVSALKSGESFGGFWRERAGYVEALLADREFAIGEGEGGNGKGGWGKGKG